VLPAFERTGALIAKKAADTIRKVWIFLVFMRTPFLTALLSRSSAECGALKTLHAGRGLDSDFHYGSAIL